MYADDEAKKRTTEYEPEFDAAMAELDPEFSNAHKNDDVGNDEDEGTTLRYTILVDDARKFAITDPLVGRKLCEFVFDLEAGASRWGWRRRRARRRTSSRSRRWRRGTRRTASSTPRAAC